MHVSTHITHSHTHTQCVCMQSRTCNRTRHPINTLMIISSHVVHLIFNLNLWPNLCSWSAEWHSALWHHVELQTRQEVTYTHTHTHRSVLSLRTVQLCWVLAWSNGLTSLHITLCCYHFNATAGQDHGQPASAVDAPECDSNASSTTRPVWHDLPWTVHCALKIKLRISSFKLQATQEINKLTFPSVSNILLNINIISININITS